MYMHRVSRGKVNILGGDSIGYCRRKKGPHGHVSNSEWLPRHSCLNLHVKKNMNVNKDTELTDNLIVILI